jgi:predicted dehydrogenase
MEKQKVRIGFVGAGFMGQMAHLRNYVALPDCEVVALAEMRPRTGREVATRYGIPRLYANHAEMLAKEKLDGVVCAQPFDVHAALLPEIYGRVKNLFTEKPLAIGVEAGARLAAEALQTGTVHMVGYHKRSDPATIYARHLIEQWKTSGEMGELRYVRITIPPGDWIGGGDFGHINMAEPMPPVVREPPLTDLPGADAEKSVWQWEGPAGEYVRFINYYIHQVNYMRHMLDEPYRLVFADTRGVLLAVESASGITGTIEMAPYRTTIDWQENILVAFEKGYIRIHLPAPLVSNRAGVVEVLRDPGHGVTPETIVPILPCVHAMRQQAAIFLKVCRGEIKPPCDAAEAVEDLKIARDYIRLWKGI